MRFHIPYIFAEQTETSNAYSTAAVHLQHSIPSIVLTVDSDHEFWTQWIQAVPECKLLLISK